MAPSVSFLPQTFPVWGCTGPARSAGTFPPSGSFPGQPGLLRWAAQKAPWSHLVRLPVPEEVDRAVQAPLDDGPAPRVVPLVAPHLHEAVGVLWLHQVDGAGVVAVLQGLQAVSPWAWRHRHTRHRPPHGRATESHSHPARALPLWQYPPHRGLTFCSLSYPPSTMV